VPGIAVVTNPRSRQNRRNPGIAGQLAYTLGTRGQVAAPRDRAELVEVAARFRDAEVDVLAINGGDGTAHVVLTAFLAAYGDRPLPPVALLRGGTMNTVASGLGIRGTAATLLDALVRRYHQGEPFPTAERHLLVVDGAEPRAGFLFGTGLLANFLEAYYEGAEPSPAKAALLLARAALSAVIDGAFIRRIMRPTEVEAEVDGVRWDATRFLSVCAGTVDDIGLGFRPFYESVRYPGRMHALGLHCSPLDVVRALPRIWRALPIEHPEVDSAVAGRLVLRSSTPIAYMVDGDFHQGDREITARVGPSVRFILG
jgi:diacylglycerol kinase family enzyme